MEKCHFCKIKNIQSKIIFENKSFYSIFDIHPVSPGHALVIPKRHVISLLDLTDEEWIDLKPAIKKTIKIIESTNLEKTYKEILNKNETKNVSKFCKSILSSKYLNKKPNGYNIGNNEGATAGRTIHHLHIQIIPRFKGDVKNKTGGIRNIIPEKGDYKS